MRRRRLLAAAAGVLAALIGTIAPGGSAAGGSIGPRLYVSIGDSYAAGMQPTSSTERRPTRNGFAYQIVDRARRVGYPFSLVNFGCGGATTGSLLHRTGCDHDRLGRDATPYDRSTQAAAAERFLRAHRGQVGLITVVIGLNDVIPCATAVHAAHCMAHAVGRIRTHLGTLLAGLRSAAGPAARIVGLTYPDVFLAGLLSHSARARSFAKLSVSAFRSQLNAQLRKSYGAVHASFVDVTRATGGYGSLTDKTTLPPFGTIPVPLAKICRLTFECRFQDVHPRTAGYALIARRVVDTLPPR